MVAEGNINVRTATTVTDRDMPANAYVLTAPVPQSLAILSFSQMLPNPRTQIELSAISYKPTAQSSSAWSNRQSGFPSMAVSNFWNTGI